MQDQINALKEREKLVEEMIEDIKATLKNSKKELNIIKKARKMLEKYEQSPDIPHESSLEPILS